MSTAPKGAHLAVRSVHKVFGEAAVLQGIDLEIVGGQCVAVVGKSGCGKSTLLRLIAGLEVPTAGAIQVDGVPLRGLNPTTRVMFQDARLLPWRRVIENVGLGLRQADWRERAAHALEQVGLLQHAHTWPATLSGGERQRVALARALVSDPHVLLLDEPLGALDALTRLEMQRLFERLWLEQGYTAILVTHDVEEAVALADRVLLIEAGRITLDIAVDLPRSRQHGSAAFAALKEQIVERVMGGAPARSTALASEVGLLARRTSGVSLPSAP
ncbi:MAG: ATP-binding cassette domain-containing protein [Oscillochloris sp.]|nr:ATP-binding cassette domain-containing protein [Oscillochloris sp.]